MTRQEVADASLRLAFGAAAGFGVDGETCGGGGGRLGLGGVGGCGELAFL
jgi:hypothetical protein